MNLSRRRCMILVLIGVIAVGSGLVVLAWNSQLIVSTSYLQVSGFTHQDDAGYGADVLDHNATVVNIGVLASNLVSVGATEIPLTVSISHEWRTDLKSLELIFSSSEVLSVALDVLEGSPWANVQFHRTSDGRGILFYDADLGFMGTATVTLNFFIEMASAQQSMNYDVYFQFTLQNGTPFTFSNIVAETQLDIQCSRA